MSNKLRKVITTFSALLFVFGQIFAQETSTSNREIMLELAVNSAPSREVWLGAAFGARFRKNEFRIHILFNERRAAYQNWGKANHIDNTANYAFAFDHRYPIWEAKRWAIMTHTISQLQKIDVYDALEIVGYPRTYIRSYGRFQLSAGIGLQYSFAKRFYLFHSIRYGFAIGNFYRVPPITEHFLTAISTGLSIGVRL